MQKTDDNSQQGNDCCNNSDQSCCSTPTPKKSSSWKKRASLFIMSLAVILAISAAGKVGIGDSDSCGTSPSITDFDWIKTEEKVAFVLLKGSDETTNSQLEATLKDISEELTASKNSASIFILEENSEHFTEVKNKCKVATIPAIITLGVGCQSSVLTENINLTSLVKSFILASTPTSSCSKSSASSSCCSKSKS